MPGDVTEFGGWEELIDVDEVVRAEKQHVFDAARAHDEAIERATHRLSVANYLLRRAAALEPPTPEEVAAADERQRIADCLAVLDSDERAMLGDAARVLQDLRVRLAAIGTARDELHGCHLGARVGCRRRGPVVRPPPGAGRRDGTPDRKSHVVESGAAC